MSTQRSPTSGFTRATAQLVASLRAQGVREIMVYDRAGALRLQANGARAARIVSDTHR